MANTRSIALYLMCNDEERTLIGDLAERHDVSMRELVIRAVRAYANLPTHSMDERVMELEARVEALESR